VGSLTLPTSGRVYLDTSPLIYTVEKHPDYLPLLTPLWAAASAGQFKLVTSELALLETMVGPVKQNDAAVAAMYENVLRAPEIRMLPITEQVLRQAITVRAQTNLKPPDAIHAASALVAGCIEFITNDGAFRRVTGLNVTVLHEII
jgi:predicted nucleic acid-binding protein